MKGGKRKVEIKGKWKVKNGKGDLGQVAVLKCKSGLLVPRKVQDLVEVLLLGKKASSAWCEVR